MSKYLSLINGEFEDKISVLDRGLSYGDGLFETMSWCFLKEENIVGVEFWKRHVSRIRKTCMLMKIKMPSLRILNEYKNKILNKALHSGIHDGVLKIIITRGVGGRGYKFDKKILPSVIFLCFPSILSKHKLKKEIKVTYCQSPITENKQLAGLKHLNRLDSVMARAEWDNNFYEGIICDSHKNLIEGTMTNIFFIKNNNLYTPKINKSGIGGIMRQVILEKSKFFFEKVVEVKVKKESVISYDGMFLTNSIIKVLPVNTFEKKIFFQAKPLSSLISYFENEVSKVKNLELS